MNKASISNRVTNIIDAVSDSLREGSITWKIEENKNNRLVFRLDGNYITTNEASRISSKLKEEFSDQEEAINVYITSGNGLKKAEDNVACYPVTDLSKSGKSANELYKKRIYSSPTLINLEITEGCNFKCNHCYNPWREVSPGKNHIDKAQFDYLLNEFR